MDTDTLSEAKKLLYELDFPSGLGSEMTREGDAIFLKHLQKLLDLLKILNGRYSSRAFSAIFLLLARCISDLVAAFHLGKHGYSIQCYTLLRPILETLNLIELFFQFPDLGDTWIQCRGEDRKEFKPSEVRKKLGKERYDPIYSELCKMGSHPTSRIIDDISSIVGTDSNVPQIQVFIGPSSHEHTIRFSYSLSLLLLRLIMLKLTHVGADKIPQDERRNTIRDGIREQVDFEQKYISPFLRKGGVDTTEVDQFMVEFEKQMEKENWEDDWWKTF